MSLPRLVALLTAMARPRSATDDDDRLAKQAHGDRDERADCDERGQREHDW